MKTEHLKPFVKPVCVACQAYSPECLVPVGEGAVPMCWYCAHHVVEHDVPLHLACAAECECTPDQVYPKHVMDARRFRLEKSVIAPVAVRANRRQPPQPPKA